MKYLKVEGENHLVRDNYSKSLLSTDNRGLEEYKRLREIRRSEKESIMKCQADINKLTVELSDIKHSIHMLIEKLNKG